MTSKNKTVITILFSTLGGFLLGGIIVFIGVSNYLGKYSADIAARNAASQLTLDVQVLESLAGGHQNKAIELVMLNVRQKYTYLSSLRHDASERTRNEANVAITYARTYLGDELIPTKHAE